MTDTPESATLALGTLIGTVNGLVKTLEKQNEAFAENRKEVMDIFKGMREDSKELGAKIDTHMRDDGLVHNIVLELKNWKDDAAPKVDNLWDTQNKGKGAAWASGVFGTFIGGIIVAAADIFFKR